MKSGIWIVAWLVAWGIFVIAIYLMTGCRSTDVRTENWSMNLSSMLQTTEFDRAHARIDPNGVIDIEFEKYSSDSQKLIELLKTALAGTAIGVAPAVLP